MCFDFFTGLVKALVVHGYIDSNRAAVGAAKKIIIYCITALLVDLVATSTGLDTFHLAHGFFMIIIIGEAISIIENTLAIHKGKDIKKVDVYSLASAKLTSFLTSVLKSQNLDNQEKDDKK